MGGGFDPRSAASIVRDEAFEENVKKAAQEVIDEQINLGIDVITDGEVERGTFMDVYSNELQILIYPFTSQVVSQTKDSHSNQIGISYSKSFISFWIMCK